MTRSNALACAAFLVIAGGCEPEPHLEMGSRSQGIYYGTREPENVTLTDGQMLAIGWFFNPGRTSQAWCSGTIIAPRVVVSADHCLHGVSPDLLTYPPPEMSG